MLEYTMRKVADLKQNPDNPRQIKRQEYNRLLKSLKKRPNWIYAKPLIVDADGVVYGGNQRLHAIQELGWEEVPTIAIEDWSEEEIAEFVIVDNVHAGEFDIDMLANNYERDLLLDLGLQEKQLGVFMSEYEEEVKSIDNSKADTPIVPKFSEEYNSVVIFCDNELDFNWMKNVLDLKSKKDYKNKRMGECHVLHVKEFQTIIETL